MKRLLLVVSLVVLGSIDQSFADSSSREARMERLSTRAAAKVQARTLASKCSNIKPLVRGWVWKAKSSSHIRPPDPRVGKPSLITLRSSPVVRASCVQIFDKKGKLLGSLGQYTPTGAAYSWRGYGGHGCGRGTPSASSLASAARKNTGSPEVYLRVAGSTCLKIPNAGICYNSIGC